MLNISNWFSKLAIVIVAFLLASCASAPASSPVAAEAKADPQCLSGDCWNGNGTYEYKSGDRYQGSFANGRWNGAGRLIFKDGTYYSGNWVDGDLNGSCRKYKQPEGEMIGTCVDKDNAIKFTEDLNEAKKRKALIKLKGILNK